MTLVHVRDDRVMLAVDDVEIHDAKSVSERVARVGGVATVDIVAPDGQKIAVSPALAEVLRAVVDAIADGARISIQAVPKEATTTTAAKMLGISRPTLMKLIAEGALPAHKVGSHTRILTADVLAFRRQQRESQRRAFDELRDLDGDLEMAP